MKIKIKNLKWMMTVNKIKMMMMKVKINLMMKAIINQMRKTKKKLWED